MAGDGGADLHGRSQGGQRRCSSAVERTDRQHDATTHGGAGCVGRAYRFVGGLWFAAFVGVGLH